MYTCTLCARCSTAHYPRLQAICFCFVSAAVYPTCNMCCAACLTHLYPDVFLPLSDPNRLGLRNPSHSFMTGAGGVVHTLLLLPVAAGQHPTPNIHERCTGHPALGTSKYKCKHTADASFLCGPRPRATLCRHNDVWPHGRVNLFFCRGPNFTSKFSDRQRHRR